MLPDLTMLKLTFAELGTVTCTGVQTSARHRRMLCALQRLVMSKWTKLQLAVTIPASPPSLPSNLQQFPLRTSGGPLAKPGESGKLLTKWLHHVGGI